MADIEEPQTERELLLDIRKDVRYLRKSHEKLEMEVHGEDGHGGLCGQVDKLKNQQSQWVGRDGIIVVGVPLLVSVALWVISRGGP